MKQESKKNAEKESLQKEVWAIFSREQDLDKIRNVVSECFGLESAKSGNSVAIGNEYCTVEFSILLPSMGEEEEKFIREQKNAACGFFSQIQDCNEDIKINLCHHIQQAQAFVYIEIEATNPNVDWDEELEYLQNICMDVTEEVDGILIVGQGTAALAVVEEKRAVVLSESGSSDLESYFPFVLEENPEFLADCTDRQKQRRNENMKYLFDKGIYVCELPLNEDDEDVSIRSKEEVARRALGLMVVSLYSESMLNPEENMSVAEAREFIGQVMTHYAIGKPEEILTPEELAYVQDDKPKEVAMVQYSWNYENLYVLEWVLGMVEWNDPVEICDVGLMVRNMRAFDSIEDICKKTTMRSVKEILDKADLVYRMDWAAVDARIHCMEGPAGLEHGVVQEWHKTLNWMIKFNEDEWDDVSTPT